MGRTCVVAYAGHVLAGQEEAIADEDFRTRPTVLGTIQHDGAIGEEAHEEGPFGTSVEALASAPATAL